MLKFETEIIGKYLEIKIVVDNTTINLGMLTKDQCLDIRNSILNGVLKICEDLKKIHGKDSLLIPFPE
jgi:hypothetical protein